MNKIKKVLESQGRSKVWLANELGVHKTTVYKYCANTMQPDLIRANQIALLLGLTMEDLIG